jgi:GT2 family glycosyltransferase
MTGHGGEGRDVRATVIVPAHNAARTLPACLTALRECAAQAVEIIVVDDRSSDGTTDVARAFAVHVTPSAAPGPAAARNTGARLARGDVLVFVDADVVVRGDTLGRLLGVLDATPGLAAVFGSYDDEPSEPNFLSQFKNLVHHFVHQHSPAQAMTFWAGCGAIRRDVFEAMGGFAAGRFPHPSIEDVELGLRLWKHGHPVRLDPSIQAKHLKRWGALGLLHTDIFRRAVPWSKLILETGIAPNQLNLAVHSRWSAALVLASAATVALLILDRTLGSRAALSPWTLPAALLVGAVAINRPLYSFFRRRRGLSFAARAVFWHQLYYVYSSVTFASCWLFHQLMRARRAPP